MPLNAAEISPALDVPVIAKNVFVILVGKPPIAAPEIVTSEIGRAHV